MERSFKEEVALLRLGEGAVFGSGVTRANRRALVSTQDRAG
jgi:hypothetical protein